MAFLNRKSGKNFSNNFKIKYKKSVKKLKHILLNSFCIEINVGNDNQSEIYVIWHVLILLILWFRRMKAYKACHNSRKSGIFLENPGIRAAQCDSCAHVYVTDVFDVILSVCALNFHPPFLCEKLNLLLFSLFICVCSSSDDIHRAVASCVLSKFLCQGDDSICI